MIPVECDADGLEPAKGEKKQRKLSAEVRQCLEALTDALIAHGRPAPPDLQLPADVRVVSKDEWENHCQMRGILNPERRMRWQQMSRAANQLADRKLIGRLNGYVWLTAQP